MHWASLGIFKVHIKQLRQTYHSASACRIFSKSDHPRQSYDVISFSRWRPRHRNFPFSFRDFDHPKRSKSTCIPNFGDISQSTAEILLLAVSENKRPPCWNFTCIPNFGEISQSITTSGFWKQTSVMLEFYFRFRFFNVCLTMSFCICLPNFVQIGPPATVMTSRPFFKMAAVSRIELSQGYCRPPTKCKWGLRWVLKFTLDRIYSFGDIAMFVVHCCIRRACPEMKG